MKEPNKEQRTKSREETAKKRAKYLHGGEHEGRVALRELDELPLRHLGVVVVAAQLLHLARNTHTPRVSILRTFILVESAGSTSEATRDGEGVQEIG